MTGSRNEPDTLFRVLAEEAEGRPGRHLELETLADYHAGQLDEAAEERLREHLGGCRECADRLLDLAPLMGPEAPRDDGVKDLEIEAAWRRLQGRLAADEVPRRSGWRSPVAALAASLAVATIALGLWAARLQQANSALERAIAAVNVPVVNMPQLYLDGLTRGDDPSETVFEVPAAASHYAVFLSVADPLPADEYEVQFVTAAGRVQLTVDGLEMSPSGSLRLGLPRKLLPAGAYRVRVRGLWGGEWRQVAEYRRILSYADRPTITGRNVEPGPR